MHVLYSLRQTRVYGCVYCILLGYTRAAIDSYSSAPLVPGYAAKSLGLVAQPHERLAQTPPFQNTFTAAPSQQVMEGWSFDLGATPKWYQQYHAWHAAQRRELEAKLATGATLEGVKPMKFMMVLCQGETPCGGLADRIKFHPWHALEAYRTGRVLLMADQKRSH